MQIYRPYIAPKTWKQMPDLIISQANPVSDTLYPVLPTTVDVKSIFAWGTISWAITQPTNLRLVATVDGRTIVYTKATPVTATPYYPGTNPGVDAGQALDPYSVLTLIAMNNMRGKSVKVDAAVTWGVTQPTPLQAGVKYAVLA